MVGKKNKPKFNVMNLGFMTGIKPRWRRPRGTNNSKRMRFEWAGKSPRIGYKNAPSARGLHPLGLPEILVSNISQLHAAAGHVVRIASQVGTRKAIEIEKAAAAAKLMVVNPRKVPPKEGKAKIAKPEPKKEEGKPEVKARQEPAKPAPQAQKPSPAGHAPAQPAAPQTKGGKR